MRSGLFNSEIIGYDVENMPIFDRAEDASFYAKYFSQFISNGVFPNPSTNMQVLAMEGMKVKVELGVCYINGYMGWVETPEVLEIEESDFQSRIDRIVARLDFVDRSIKLFVKKGEALGNPIPPELQREYDIYEIGLADIRVNANEIEITQENITDLRLNTEICGIVANQLQHVDTTTLFNQYQDWLRRVTGEAEADLKQKKEAFEDYLNSLKLLFSEDFNNWFQGIKDTLSGDIAGNLLNLINVNRDLINTNKEKINTKADLPRSKEITLLSSNWVQNEETKKYENTIQNENITTTDYIIFDVLNEEQKDVIAEVEVESYNGYYVFKSNEQININVGLQLVIMRTKVELEVSQ